MSNTQHPEPPAFGLVIVGDEILSGKRADKHMPKLIELLAARGLQLEWAEYVGDSPDRIAATLKRAFDSGTSCSPAAASARRRTTTPGSAPAARSASSSNCIRKPRR